MATMLAYLTLVPFSASATDNDTGKHWDFGYTYYHVVTNTLESRYVTAIVNAANKWKNQTAVDYLRGANQSSANYSSTSTHLLWMGTIPSAWQASCATSTSLACTRTVVGTSNHLTDADTVFDATDNWTNDCPWWPGAYIDMETVALHELGHWGVLSHSTDVNATMYRSYDFCDQTLSQHDIDSMNANYVH